MTQATTTIPLLNVSTAVGGLKSRFMREWSRDPTEEETMLWNNANRTLTCWNCAQLKVECKPETQGSLPCTRCVLLKSQQICTRVIEERRARVKRVMNLDEDTFQALKATCFENTKSPTSNPLELPRPSDVTAPVYQRTYPTPEISLHTHHPTSSVPSTRSPLSSSTQAQEVIDLTYDSDSTVVPRRTRPQSPRPRPPSSRGHAHYHARPPYPTVKSEPGSHNLPHVRQITYPATAAAPFGIFASGSSPLSPSSPSQVSYLSRRRGSFNDQTPISSMSTPPASAPPMSLPFSRRPPVQSPPTNQIFTSSHRQATRDDSRPRHHTATLNPEALTAIQQEVDRLRQVTTMLAQQNREIHSFSERYREEVARSSGSGGEPDKVLRSPEETIMRLQDELDKSRHLNRKLAERNEELRDAQKDTEELRRAYRALYERNETLERQHRIAMPVRMMGHMQLASPDREDVEMTEEPQQREIETIRRELDLTLRELTLAKEELTSLTERGATRIIRPSGEQAESSDTGATSTNDDTGRHAISEHTDLQLVIRSLTRGKEDFSANKISENDMLELCSRLEKQLTQIAQRVLEAFTTSPTNGNRTVGRDPTSPDGPISPSSGGNMSPETRASLKRRRIGDDLEETV